jgi:hypothetical protein
MAKLHLHYTARAQLRLAHALRFFELRRNELCRFGYREQHD